MNSYSAFKDILYLIKYILFWTQIVVYNGYCEKEMMFMICIYENDLERMRVMSL